ncbi:MAG: alpha/beta hydrolase [Gemmatimonadetes bacterium]|nr:alpha/beta hydrolase [Gemmatimonadota bacterium]
MRDGRLSPGVAIGALALTGATLAATAPPPAYDEPRTLDIRVAPGEILRVESSGAGRPVVFIPGLLGSAYSFRKIVEPLAREGYHAVVVEPLGIGSSARPSDADYSLEAQAGRVAAVLDSLHIDDATLVAHSVGASVAMRLAVEHPDRVARIISIEGGPAEQTGTKGLRTALKFAGVLRFFGLGGSIVGRLRSGLEKSSGDRSWITDDVVDHYVAPFHEDFGAALRAYRAMASARDTVPLAPRLDQIHVPVALLVGTAPHESGVAAEEIRLMSDSIGQFRLIQVPGAGHWIQEEQPRAVLAAIRDAN